MFRTLSKKVPIEIPADPAVDQLHEHPPPSTRMTLKTIQTAATEKENYKPGGAPLKPVEHEAKRKKMFHKFVQTSEEASLPITAEDLTSESPGENYWRLLAEKRAAALNDSFKENEKLKEEVDNLKEENQTCKEMLNESRCLIEVLEEMLNEAELNKTKDEDEAEEADNQTD